MKLRLYSPKKFEEYGFEIKTIKLTTKNSSVFPYYGNTTSDFHYIEVNDEGICHIDGSFVNIDLPSRKGSIGKVIGIKGYELRKNSELDESYCCDYKLIVKFDDVNREVLFEDHQLSICDATETKYVYHQKEPTKKNTFLRNKFKQIIEVDDYVVGKKKGRLFLGKVIKINPKSVRIKLFEIKGNHKGEETLFFDEVFKIEKDLNIEEQIALMALQQ